MTGVGMTTKTGRGAHISPDIPPRSVGGSITVVSRFFSNSIRDNWLYVIFMGVSWQNPAIIKTKKENPRVFLFCRPKHFTNLTNALVLHHETANKASIKLFFFSPVAAHGYFASFLYSRLLPYTRF